MKRIIEIIKDLIKCISIGTIISLVVILVFGLISLLVSKFNLQHSLQVIKSTLLIIGPLGMILSAFLILKNREEKEFEFIEQWKRKFNIFSYKIVFILVSVIIILYGGIIDWVIFVYK